VILRAEQVLQTLEQGEQAGVLATLADDLPLFRALPAHAGAIAPAAGPSAIEDALAAVEPDALTPREALEVIYRLRALLP
jgi:DNA mismatch repair protein MutS